MIEGPKPTSRWLRRAVQRALPGCRQLHSGLCLAAVTALALPAHAAETGFVINGVYEDDGGLLDVAGAGDVNGDGLADILIGSRNARRVEEEINNEQGRAFLVFGRADGFPDAVELADLLLANGGDGSRGVVFNGFADGDDTGGSVAAAGDVNGDGLDDLIIGARLASVPDRPTAGRAYVVLGSSMGFPAEIELNDLATGDGSTGFVLDGAVAGIFTGEGVSGVGDVNGDGVDDIAVAASRGEPFGRDYAGEVYVVYGSTDGFDSVVDLADIRNGNADLGTVIGGIREDDAIANLTRVGDLNGDGIDDIAIATILAAPGGRSFAGQTYVVFGVAGGLPTPIDLATLPGGDGSTGFVINGINAQDFAGEIAGVGDVNGDGLADLMIGAYGADPGGLSWAGESYVLFGRSDGFPARIELAALAGGDGSEGFVLNGISGGPTFFDIDESGKAVGGAGDVNGDGLPDLLIGAPSANGADEPLSGETYIVFGTTDAVPAEFELSQLKADNGGDGTLGVVIGGATPDEMSGFRVANAGDINGDGLAELLIAAPAAAPGGRQRAGLTYVVFGNDGGFPPEISLADLLPLGGELRALTAFFLGCRNETTGQVVVDFPPESNDTPRPFTCVDLGLDFTPGDEIVVFGRGEFRNQGAVGGAVRGADPGDFAVCRNLTNGSVAVAPIQEDSSWDCGAAGLTINAGDIITTLGRGVAR